jgi:hypothetical protein
VLVDGQPTFATGYDEQSDVLTDAAAIQLGNEPSWIAGIIGDTRLRGSDAATNEVDFYRFDLPAGEHYALNLRVLAQRFGSSLDPALSLFDSVGQLLATNDDSMSVEAASDSAIYTGLNGGTYYVAVSAGGNLPVADGGFDPFVPGSASASRGTRGPYLLQLSAVPDNERPQVVQTSLAPEVTEHLTEITVQFSEPMDLLGLQHGAALQGPDGLSIGLSAASFDPETLEATYRLNTRPIAGDYVFTLSATAIRDRAQNPISGDGADGGFALEFSYDPPATTRADTEPNGAVESSQDLGPLYRDELRSGVLVTGAVDSTGDQDFYRFQVTRLGFFNVQIRPGAGTNQTGLLMIRDGEGKLLGQGFRFPGIGGMLIRLLKPGEYIIQVNGDGIRPGGYTLKLQSASENEVPLIDGSVAPSVSAVLSTHDGERPATDGKPAASAAPIVVVTDAMTYSVDSMPAVAGQPVGRPERPVAGPAEMAWVDLSSERRRVLPDGVVLQRSNETTAQFSVASVSGSFLDPLPDSVFSRTDASNATTLGSDLRAAMAMVWNSDQVHAAGEQVLESSDGALAANGSARDEFGELAEARVIDSPSGLAFGMVASLGAVGAAAAPNRRRPTDWIHQVFDWLGFES